MNEAAWFLVGLIIGMAVIRKKLTGKWLRQTTERKWFTGDTSDD